MNRRVETQEVAVEKLVDALVHRDAVAQAIDLAAETLEIWFSEYRDFSFEGIEDKGFWSRAWQLTSTYHEDVRDMYQEVVLAAIELVTKDEAIAEKGPGYLLQAATWRAQNAVRKFKSTFLVMAHNVTVVSLDDEDRTGTPKVERAATPMVDFSLKTAVHQVVNRLDDTDAKIAEYLMDGYSKSEVADLLGVTRAAISYRLRKMKREIEAQGITETWDPGAVEPEMPKALRPVWFA